MTEVALDDFTKVMRKRLDDFNVWYTTRHEADPESYPMKLGFEEWFEEFRQEVEEQEEE